MEQVETPILCQCIHAKWVSLATPAAVSFYVSATRHQQALVPSSSNPLKRGVRKCLTIHERSLREANPPFDAGSATCLWMSAIWIVWCPSGPACLPSVVAAPVLPPQDWTRKCLHNDNGVYSVLRCLITSCASQRLTGTNSASRSTARTWLIWTIPYSYVDTHCIRWRWRVVLELHNCMFPITYNSSIGTSRSMNLSAQVQNGWS